MAATTTRTANAETTTDDVVYTFLAQSLGVAATNRYITVGVLSRGLSDAHIVGVTIGGAAMTAVANIRNSFGGDTTNAGLFTKLVPAGTTADIVVTHFDECLRCAIVVFRTVGSTGIITDFGTSSADDPTTSLDVLAGGTAIGVSYGHGNITCTWVGLTEDVDADLDGTAAQYTGAHGDFASAQVGLTVTANWSAPTANLSAGAFASFAPLAPVTVDVPTGALAFTGAAPAIRLHTRIGIPAASMTLIGQAPAARLGPLTISIPAGVQTLTGAGPSAVLAAFMKPPAGSLSLTAAAPALRFGYVVPTASLSLAGQAPSVALGPYTIVVPAAGMTLSGLAPKLADIVAIPAGSLVLTGLAPAVNFILLPPSIASTAAFGTGFAIGTAWGDLTLLHVGPIRWSPWETNELAAGRYRIVARVIDSSGNLSEPVEIIAELGNPRLRAVILQRLEHDLGWPGTLIDCHIQDDILVADSGGDWSDLPDTWAELADTWATILPSASPIAYRTPILDLGTDVGFTPLITVEGTGAQAITMAYGMDGESPTVGAFGPAEFVVARYVQFQIEMAGSEPTIETMVILLDGDVQIDEFEDIDTATETASWFESIAPGHFRVGSKSGLIAAITSAQVTALQNVGPGWSPPVLINKTSIVDGEPAAEFKLYDETGTLADAVIDVQLRGPKRG